MNTLDAETIAKARQMLGKPARILVGLTMPPHVEIAMRRQAATVAVDSLATSFLGVPVIVDDRMRGNSATAYYDRKIWRKRVKDQRRHDFRRAKEMKNLLSSKP
jgi:hypothetical protein